MTRTRRTIATALPATLLACLLTSPLCGPLHAAPVPPRPLVGAIRWDAWTRWAGETGWGGYEKCLGPARWHYRLPFYARVVSDDAVEVRADTPEVMAREIDYAARGGIDYWAFDWYHPRAWPNAANMTRCLDLYRRSRGRAKVRYCLVLQGGVHMGPKDEWPATTASLAAMFREPNYQKVLGGRPLVYLYGHKELTTYWGGERAAAAALDELRHASVTAGAGDPYLVLMCYWPPVDAPARRALGFDAMSSYVNPPGSDNRELPFADSIGLNRQFWEKCSEAGEHLIPTVNTGWDYRPMKRPEFPDRDPRASWLAQARPEEIGANVAAALQWVRANPAACEANCIVLYAWNEFSEGGWLAPTLADGQARLDSIRRAIASFAPRAASPRTNRLPVWR